MAVRRLGATSAPVAKRIWMIDIPAGAGEIGEGFSIYRTNKETCASRRALG